MVHYKVSYKELKAKLPTLTQEQFNAKYADLKRDYSAPADPNIVFNDGAKTIEIHYFGEDLLMYNRPLANALKSAFPFGTGSTPQIIEQTFLTPEGETRKTEILENSRETLRQTGYKEVPSNTPAPDPTASSLDNLKAIVASNPNGVSMGGGHGDGDRNALMDQLLADPGHGGMSLFFIEEIGVVDQPLVNQFLASAVGDPMPPVLENRVKAIAGMKEMLTKMRDHNAANPGDKLKAYGINSAEAKSRDGLLELENRVAMMNAVAKDVMDRAIADNPGKKFMAFCRRGALEHPPRRRARDLPDLWCAGGQAGEQQAEDGRRRQELARDAHGRRNQGHREDGRKVSQEPGGHGDGPGSKARRTPEIHDAGALGKLVEDGSRGKRGDADSGNRLRAGGPARRIGHSPRPSSPRRRTPRSPRIRKLDTDAEAEVSAKKHAELVKDLTGKLRALPADKKDRRIRRR